MASTQAVALSTMLRITTKTCFGAMDSIAMMRRSALGLNRVCMKEAGLLMKPVQLSCCETQWVFTQGLKTDRVILYIPGGGFVMRTPALHRSLVGRVVKVANAKALLVFYRLAPEDPYPCGLEDCIEAYEHLLAHGIPASRIVVGGDSAGANLALALLLRLRDGGRPLPAAAFVISPVTDLRDHKNGSRSTNRHADPILWTIHGSRLNPHELYVGGNRELFRLPTVSPVLADFHGLPPLMFQVGSTEILLDDSRIAARKAQGAGTPAVLEIWEDMPHIWHAFNLPESRRATAHLGDFIRQHCP